jgi:hypothetical protein
MTPESGRDHHGELPSREDVASLVRRIDEEATKKEERWRAPNPSPRRFPVKGIALGALVALNAFLWIAQPGWLVGEGGRPSTPEARERALRSTMYVQALRIEGYRGETGALPEDLDAVGRSGEGLAYSVTGPDSWELRGETDGREIVLRSSDRRDSFLRGR